MAREPPAPEATGARLSRGCRPAERLSGRGADPRINPELSARPRGPGDPGVLRERQRAKVSLPFWRFLSRPPEVPRLPALAAGDRLGVGGAERPRVTPARPQDCGRHPRRHWPRGPGEGGALMERGEGRADFLNTRCKDLSPKHTKNTKNK